MARNHAKAVTTRRSQGTRQMSRFILFVEGRNTEPGYFELLRRSNCKVIPVVVPGKGIGSCTEFVREASKRYGSLPKQVRDKYSQRWLVYDCDGHDDFTQSIRMARESGFRVAFSNMCIEYWFALHFHELDGSPIPMKGDSHSQAQIDLINRAIELYNRKAVVKVAPYDSGSKAVTEDFFDLLMAISPETHRPRVVDAYVRARNIHEVKKAQGAETRESVTTMYELMHELGVVTEDVTGALTSKTVRPETGLSASPSLK